jgi:hypothetical protein
MRTIVSAGVVALLLGCHYRPEPVPISGNRAAISSLAGTWLGDYSGSESGRSGSITFIIRASGDSAFGDVLMVAAGNAGVVRPVDLQREHLAHVQSAQALRIDFVTVADGEVTGTLEPYIAPDCDCRVTTTFSGRHRDNAIDGTFVTRGPGTFLQRGTWRVLRNR